MASSQTSQGLTGHHLSQRPQPFNPFHSATLSFSRLSLMPWHLGCSLQNGPPLGSAWCCPRGWWREEHRVKSLLRSSRHPGTLTGPRSAYRSGFFTGALFTAEPAARGDTHLDLWLSSRLVTNLRGICIHVNLRFILRLSKEHLRPSSQASLQPDAQYPFNLQREHVPRTVFLPKLARRAYWQKTAVSGPGRIAPDHKPSPPAPQPHVFTLQPRVTDH